MNAKITKKRLVHMLSYDWLKIVGTAAAAILVWVLIFTMTATRIRPSQQFAVLNHYHNVRLTDKFYNSYSATLENGVFSYEVIEMTNTDLAENPEYAGTLIEGRLAIEEGDIMFVPNIGDEDYAVANEDGTTGYKYTCIESFMRGYRQYVYTWDDYLANMQAYLNGFYDGGYQTGTLNEEKVASAFRTRAEENNDKRFKKEAQITQGIANDVVRIQKYRDALVKTEQYLQAGVIVPTKLTLDNDGVVYYEGNATLNICPDETKAAGLKEITCYQITETNVETGKDQIRLTAQDMNIMFLKTNTESGFEFESLLYVVELVESIQTQA